MFQEENENQNFEYTKKFENKLKSEKLRKDKIKLLQEKNYQSGKKVILIFLAIIITIVFFKLCIIHFDKKENINLISTKAIITKIDIDFYRVNDLDLNNIKNYNIQYSYFIDSTEIKGMSTINSAIIKKYFNKKPKIGDSINIEYRKDNLLKNHITLKNKTPK